MRPKLDFTLGADENGKIEGTRLFQCFEPNLLRCSPPPPFTRLIKAISQNFVIQFHILAQTKSLDGGKSFLHIFLPVSTSELYFVLELFIASFWYWRLTGLTMNPSSGLKKYPKNGNDHFQTINSAFVSQFCYLVLDWASMEEYERDVFTVKNSVTRNRIQTICIDMDNEVPRSGAARMDEKVLLRFGCVPIHRPLTSLRREERVLLSAISASPAGCNRCSPAAPSEDSQDQCTLVDLRPHCTGPESRM